MTSIWTADHASASVPASSPGRRRPETLKVLAWDPDEEQLVQVEAPFWLLRLVGWVNGERVLIWTE